MSDIVPINPQPSGEISIASNVGAIAAVAREEAEIKARCAMALHNPRDETQAYTQLMTSCARVSFANGAMYRFPRGGTQISGPSVRLAREAARCWRNIEFGLRIVSEDDEQVHIVGFAYDLESGTRVSMEDRAPKRQQRKVKTKDPETGDSVTETRWVRPDERDLRELVNRRGAICVRNALLQIIPPDFIEDAIERIEETVRKAAAGDLTQDKTKAVRSLVVAFSEFGVNADMIVAYIKHPLEQINEKDLVTLRGIYSSLRDGNTQVLEHFSDDAIAKPKGTEQATEALRKKRGKGKATTEEREPATTEASAQPGKGEDATPPTPEAAAWEEVVAATMKRLDIDRPAAEVKAQLVLDELGYRMDQLSTEGVRSITLGSIKKRTTWPDDKPDAS